MIRDLYGNSIVAYKAGTQQTVNLVLDTIGLAMRREKRGSPQSCSSTATRVLNTPPKHISSQVKSTALRHKCQNGGNPYDNAMAENFFFILKTECIYRHKPATFSEANEMIDRYILFYNHERIQLRAGEAPATPLRLILYISLHRRLFVLSTQFGAVHP